jgi:hypothetical protein
MLNNFLQSAEIRWFWPGHAQWEVLLAWFTQEGRLPLVAETRQYVSQPDAGPFAKQERPRTDDYLLLPNCETVGVKQREGRLEVKALVAGPHAFAQGNVSGQIDQWVKWSLQPSAAIALPLKADLQQSGRWLGVTKRRYTQKVALLGGGLTAVSPDTFPNAGCSIELTLVDVAAGNGRWLTLGFEAFGETDRSRLLHQAMTHSFTVHGPPPLALMTRNSLSYPAWLAQLQNV